MRESNSNRGGGGGKKGCEEKKPLELDFPETEVQKGRSCNFLSLSPAPPVCPHLIYEGAKGKQKQKKSGFFVCPLGNKENK